MGNITSHDEQNNDGTYDYECLQVPLSSMNISKFENSSPNVSIENNLNIQLTTQIIPYSYNLSSSNYVNSRFHDLLTGGQDHNGWVEYQQSQAYALIRFYKVL